MIAKNLDRVIDAEEEVRDKIRISMPDILEEKMHCVITPRVENLKIG